MMGTLPLAAIRAFAAALLLCMAALTAVSQEATPWSQNVSPLPSPTGPVNDYAGVIPAETGAQLNQRLIDYQRSTGVELAVAVVRTTGDRPIFDYSLAVARGWGIGSKGDDNPSALLFVAIDDRKYFTQVSRNLEDELPDGLVGSLQRQNLVPAFRQGDYAKGVSDTIEAYIRTIDQRSSGTAASPTPVPGPEVAGRQSLSSGFCCLIVIGIILLIIFSSRGGGKRGRDRWGGGGFGGGGSVLPWIIGSAIGSSIGSSSSSSSSSDWGSGSWGGGGGSDWGGFGGGGDFGGGGAGGDW